MVNGLKRLALQLYPFTGVGNIGLEKALPGPDLGVLSS
jgi:hypothetical protein